jgi:dihydroorotate dehydrogenase/formate hydrogenlyase subunit 6/NADH:ubiquinone oxidoreductase subunit I
MIDNTSRSDPDLSVLFAGKIHSPNPFWLASAPPTNCGEQVMRAFDAGWGGAVWKTLGEPIVNVSSRYSSVDFNGQRMMGLNNIELITDRPLDVNLREISEVKKRYPRHAVIASLMVESKREAWHKIVQQAEDAGADGLSAINTINSITGIDLNTFAPRPNVDGKSSHGGYCGPAVKPIALHLCQQVQSDPDSALPLSGIGGISDWRDAAEFLLLGCSTVQVCTAVMHYGYRIVEDMADGLANWMRGKGFSRIDDFRGLTLPRVQEWKHLNLNYKIVARIHEEKCIGCALCYTACWDGAHQCIHMDRVAGSSNGLPAQAGHATPAMLEQRTRQSITVTPIPKLDRSSASGNGQSAPADGEPYPTPLARIPRVDEAECVGCNLCSLVCPVEGCITMEEIDTHLPPQSWEQRSGGASCDTKTH